MKAAFALLCIALCSTACSAFIAAPLIGYQQGLTLQVTPPEVAGGQCMVYGVPTPTGYADQAQTPLFLYTPQGTGNHVLQFVYNQSAYTLSPFLAPGQTTLQIDATEPNNPLISFNATSSPQGQSGAVTLFLSDTQTGAVYCFSQIQLTVDQPLGCLPTFGGIYANGGNDGLPSDAGQFVVPNGQVYAPTFVQQTLIEQFVTITNININQVTINVNEVTNNEVINNIINVLPPTPPVVNCTETPQEPACQSPPSPTPPATPAPGPTQTPCIRNPFNGQCIDPPAPASAPPAPAPGQNPCIRNPFDGQCLPPVPAPTQAPTVTPTSSPTPPAPTPPSTPTATSTTIPQNGAATPLPTIPAPGRAPAASMSGSESTQMSSFGRRMKV